MATKYIHKAPSTAALAAQATAAGNAAGIGVVSNTLYFNDGTNFVPVNKTPLVSLTASATLTPEAHSNRTVVVNAEAGLAITMPAASGSGNKYRIVVGTLLTSNTITVTAPSGSILKGIAFVQDIGDSAAATLDAYAAGSSDEIFTLTATAGGGKVGDEIMLEDIASGVYAVRAIVTGLPDTATPWGSA